MSEHESHERTYTFFHEDGPITLSEHELVNDYMRLREQTRLVERLRDEVSRRDVLLGWIVENVPRTLELCPFKMTEYRVSFTGTEPRE